MMFLKRLLMLGLLSVLAACTTTSPGSSPSALTQDYVRNGRFALLVYDRSLDRNTESSQGNFSWLTRAGQIQIDLSSPLGSTLARLLILPQVSQITYSDGRQLQAADPDHLLAQVLGKAIPVNGMRYWIRGEPMPGVPLTQAQYDGLKRLSHFSQGGWQIQASDYDALGPKRISLLRNEAEQRISVRFSME